jgi:hypothetical protein
VFLLHACMVSWPSGTTGRASPLTIQVVQPIHCQLVNIDPAPAAYMEAVCPTDLAESMSCQWCSHQHRHPRAAPLETAVQRCPSGAGAHAGLYWQGTAAPS